jgi:hypothetical protein
MIDQVLLYQNDEAVFDLSDVEIGSFREGGERLAAMAGKDGEDALKEKSVTIQLRPKRRIRACYLKAACVACVPGETYRSEFAVLVLDKVFAKLR